MARPVTRPVTLKDGYYLEVRHRGEQRGIKIRRETKEQMNAAIRQYEVCYDVKKIGKVEGGEVVSS